jgi:dTDP-4-amino-4,6-dideoxygalactose transaminase
MSHICWGVVSGGPNTTPAIEGGTPAFDEFLVFGKPVLGDAEIEAVADVIRSGWIGTGERCFEFEERFAALVDAEHAIAVSSCTAGLHAALVAAGIGPGDEVITTALTFVATVHAIEHAGGTAVLADVDRETLNIDPEDVARRLTPRTKAIVPVHFGGLPCELSSLRAIASDRAIAIVEDAAHAVGAVYGGKPVGSDGIACFSFYPNKNITTGEGGMITCSDGDLAERLHILRLHGLSRDAWERFRSKRVVFSDAIARGFKYNLTDLQAALGLVQLTRLESFLTARRDLASAYDRELAAVRGLRAQQRPWNEVVKHAHHLYVVEVVPEDFGMTRDDLLAALRAENIGAGVHYRAVHLHPYYRDSLAHGPDDLPTASRLSERVLSLPLSPAMTEDDVSRVGGALRRLHAYYAP